jgi:ABC-type multidrug transport system fused ATPase/permease subunit
MSLFPLFTCITDTQYHLFQGLCDYCVLQHHSLLHDTDVSTSRQPDCRMLSFIQATPGKVRIELRHRNYQLNLFVKNFFMLDELKNAPSLGEDDVSEDGGKTNVRVEPGMLLSNATAKWEEEHTVSTLNNVTVAVIPGKLLGVIGPVGSGKVWKPIFFQYVCK